MREGRGWECVVWSFFYFPPIRNFCHVPSVCIVSLLLGLTSSSSEYMFGASWAVFVFCTHLTIVCVLHFNLLIWALPFLDLLSKRMLDDSVPNLGFVLKRHASRQNSQYHNASITVTYWHWFPGDKCVLTHFLISSWWETFSLLLVHCNTNNCFCFLTP